jgi:hypothetical protein
MKENDPCSFCHCVETIRKEDCPTTNDGCIFCDDKKITIKTVIVLLVFVELLLGFVVEGRMFL